MTVGRESSGKLKRGSSFNPTTEGKEGEGSSLPAEGASGGGGVGVVSHTSGYLEFHL